LNDFEVARSSRTKNRGKMRNLRKKARSSARLANTKDTTPIRHELKTILRRLRMNDPTLREINLGGRMIRDEGVQRIGEALYKNTNLTSLFLYDNHVTDRGFYFLADMLRKNRGLQCLNLGENTKNVSNEGVSALVEALKVCPSLNQLYLDHSVCNKETKDQIRLLLSEEGRRQVWERTYKTGSSRQSKLQSLFIHKTGHHAGFRLSPNVKKVSAKVAAILGTKKRKRDAQSEMTGPRSRKVGLAKKPRKVLEKKRRAEPLGKVGIARRHRGKVETRAVSVGPVNAGVVRSRRRSVQDQKDVQDSVNVSKVGRPAKRIVKAESDTPVQRRLDFSRVSLAMKQRSERTPKRGEKSAALHTGKPVAVGAIRKSSRLSQSSSQPQLRSAKSKKL